VAGIGDMLGLDAVALQAGQERLGDGGVVFDDEDLHAPIVAWIRTATDGRGAGPRPRPILLTCA